MTAYVRVLAASIGAPVNFCGPMAKQHRMAIMTIACLISTVEGFCWNRGTVLLVALVVIAAGCVITVGREREDIVRGLDPDLRVRLRAAGYRVVLVPGARIHHPLPDGWHRLLRMFFRNGKGSAYSRKYQPDTVYETHETLDATTFKPQTSLTYRIVRFPLRLLGALVQGKVQRFGAYCAYACGYAWGMVFARRKSEV